MAGSANLARIDLAVEGVAFVLAARVQEIDHRGDVGNAVAPGILRGGIHRVPMGVGVHVRDVCAPRP